MNYTSKDPSMVNIMVNSNMLANDGSSKEAMAMMEARFRT